MVPPWPSTAGAANPGRSAAGTSCSGSPSASAAGSHPDPITRATSWVAPAVRSASAAAASRARSVGLTCRTLRGVTHVGIIGGGPGGYEAALVAARLGADVTVVERDGLGGSTVLTDCVPSKTLIATSDLLTEVESSAELGVDVPREAEADLAAVNDRVLTLAKAQSSDIAQRLEASGIEMIAGEARLDGPKAIVVDDRRIDVDAVLLATGAHPRVSPDAQPDGERILTWEQVYNLRELPEHMIVVGSGV